MINILCIDNSKTIREVIKDSVLDLSYNFYEAEDGNQGLEIVNTIDKLDLIIVDWNMPGLSGKETLKILCDDKRFSETKFLVLIRIENKEEVIEAIEIGANNYMLKPFSVNKLQEKINEMIKNAG